MPAKTLFVGLDAACWEYMDPLLGSGQMPRLKSLIDTGLSGTMHSTMPPWTPTAWGSLVTGTNPGKHGVFDMLWRRPGTYEFTPTNTHSRRGSPFWKYLNDHGIRVGLVNVPFTYPPEPVDGFMVCGFGTPGSANDFVYPDEALAWIREQYPGFKPAVEPEILLSASPAEILATEIEHQARQVEIAAVLAERYAVDVLVINLMLTDHANHKMPEIVQVQEAYRRSDVDLGKLIDAFKPDNILLISDHGSSRLKGDFLLNAWLRDRGYYAQLPNGHDEARKALNWVLMQWLQKRVGLRGLPEQIARSVLRRVLLLLPENRRNQVLERLNETIPFAREHVMFNGHPDYARSKVFPGSVYSGLLYLNILGREPDGVIRSEHRYALAAELAAELRRIMAPDTGQPLFSNVYTAEDVYTGPAQGYAPDIILDSYSTSWNIRTSKHIPKAEIARNQYFLDVANRSDFGWHSRDGIFVFTGQGFRQERSSSEAYLMDTSATLLHLYGVPIPEDFDGRVLTELLNPELGQREIQYQQAKEDRGEPTANMNDILTREEAEDLASHLRALGYLD